MIDTNELRSMVNGAQFEGFANSVIHSLLDRLEAAEKERDALRAKIERWEPAQILPRAREIYRDLVASLEAVEDVAAAREALRQIIGDVRLVPEDGALTAEMQSPGLAGALQIALVAGARSERCLPVLRFRGLR